ncbi:MAG: PIG-L domain-containing protein [Actinobacteria bacterium]|jgi:LmbE family N-acetylglucosaminyl deacetylase|nr:PIG-L family deacetylase [Candidatus Planktophila sp.]PHX67108.1 MAG: PIG-L domain-containing protein [Actinomycetota bacterium]
MEPIPDSEIARVLVVSAHPDDSDFGASGTIAQWVRAGIKVAYVFCTNGDQGGEESGFTKEQMPAIRQREQRAAGAVIGVTDITFLDYIDGNLEATIGLRKDLVRQIRIWQPDRMVCQSPDRNWDRIGASHPDHLAAGEAAIQAVYPDARNPFAFTDLLENEGLKPWRVKEVWVSAYSHPDHFVDITDTFDLKIKALKAHASQTGHNENLEEMVREWGARNAATAGFAEGRIAEAFKIVNTN